MKKYLLPILLWALLGLASATVTPAQKALQHRATHTIVMSNEKANDGAGCSATAISEHVLLTAEHCNVPGSVLYLDQNNRPYQHPLEISERYLDHQDHMLLVLPGVSFKNFVDYGSAAPLKQGDKYYLWGNPGLIRDQYREGYVTGSIVDPIYEMEIDAVSSFLMLNGPVVGGDSGSAIFSAEDGHLAGVLTYGMEYGMFAGVYPLAFTVDQIAQAEGVGSFVYLPDTRPVVNVNTTAVGTHTQDVSAPLWALVALLSVAFAVYILRYLILAVLYCTTKVSGPVTKAVKYVGRVFKAAYQALKKI